MIRTSLRLALAAALFAALGGLAEPADAQSATWFPIEQGNSWTLRDDVSGREMKIECIYQTGSYRYVTGLFRNPVWIYTSRSYPFTNDLLVWNGDRGAWYYLFRYGTQNPRSTWRFDVTGNACDTFTAGFVAGSLKLLSLAGGFNDCRQYKADLNPEATVRCAEPPIGQIFFAPRVGPCRIDTPSGTAYRLTAAKVGATTYPQVTTGPTPTPTSGFQTTVTADQTSYTNRPNTIRCIRAPCPSNEVTAEASFTLTVTNASSQSQTLDFSSGRQSDFEILDSNGRVVAAWSDDKFFTQALTRMTFAPGESKRFTGSIPLKGRDGLQLNGSYTVRGFLPARNGPDGTTPIRVTVQP